MQLTSQILKVALVLGLFSSAFSLDILNAREEAPLVRRANPQAGQFAYQPPTSLGGARAHVTCGAAPIGTTQCREDTVNKQIQGTATCVQVPGKTKVWKWVTVCRTG